MMRRRTLLCWMLDLPCKNSELSSSHQFQFGCYSFRESGWESCLNGEKIRGIMLGKEGSIGFEEKGELKEETLVGQ